MNEEVESTLREDPVLAPLIDEHDIQTERNWTGFERLCLSIINQQLSTASAAAVKERVFGLLDGDVTPETVLAADEDLLRDAGLSRMKTGYIRNAARAFQEREYTPAGLADYSDEEVITLLTEIKGIGQWTARMYLIFVLERADVLPLGDLAIRNGIQHLYGDGNALTREEMRDVADAWRPYRSVATRYIWAEYETEQ